jgi:hypothetical protein
VNSGETVDNFRMKALPAHNVSEKIASIGQGKTCSYPISRHFYVPFWRVR